MPHRPCWKPLAPRSDKAGLDDRISLVHGLAEDLSPALFGTKDFDHVVFSYSLSMIPDWRGALRAGFAALAPNGQLHVVDFADLAGLGTPVKRALLAWLTVFHVTPRAEFLAELEAFAGNGGVLNLLFGRYAFIFSCGKR